MVHAQILHVGEAGPCIAQGCIKNEKLQPMALLKTFLPSWKKNGAIGKNKKIT